MPNTMKDTMAQLDQLGASSSLPSWQPSDDINDDGFRRLTPAQVGRMTTFLENDLRRLGVPDDYQEYQKKRRWQLEQQAKAERFHAEPWVDEQLYKVYRQDYPKPPSVVASQLARQIGAGVAYETSGATDVNLERLRADIEQGLQREQQRPIQLEAITRQFQAQFPHLNVDKHYLGRVLKWMPEAEEVIRSGPVAEEMRISSLAEDMDDKDAAAFAHAIQIVAKRNPQRANESFVKRLLRKFTRGTYDFIKGTKEAIAQDPLTPPRADYFHDPKAGRLKDEQEELRRRQLQQTLDITDPTIRPDDPWYSRFSLQAAEMAPPMIAAVVAGKAAAARSLAAGLGTGAQTASAAAATSGTFYPMIWSEEYHNLRQEGVPRDTAKTAASISAGIQAAVESLMIDPLTGGPAAIPKQTLKRIITENVKRYGTEWSEEVIQGVTSKVVEEAAKEYSGIDREGYANAVESGIREGLQAGGPLLVLMAPGAVRSFRTATVDERKARIEAFLEMVNSPEPPTRRTQAWVDAGLPKKTSKEERAATWAYYRKKAGLPVPEEFQNQPTTPTEKPSPEEQQQAQELSPEQQPKAESPVQEKQPAPEQTIQKQEQAGAGAHPQPEQRGENLDPRELSLEDYEALKKPRQEAVEHFRKQGFDERAVEIAQARLIDMMTTAGNRPSEELIESYNPEVSGTEQTRARYRDLRRRFPKPTETTAPQQPVAEPLARQQLQAEQQVPEQVPQEQAEAQATPQPETPAETETTQAHKQSSRRLDYGALKPEHRWGINKPREVAIEYYKELGYDEDAIDAAQLEWFDRIERWGNKPSEEVIESYNPEVSGTEKTRSIYEELKYRFPKVEREQIPGLVGHHMLNRPWHQARDYFTNQGFTEEQIIRAIGELYAWKRHDPPDDVIDRDVIESFNPEVSGTQLTFPLYAELRRKILDPVKYPRPQATVKQEPPRKQPQPEQPARQDQGYPEAQKRLDEAASAMRGKKPVDGQPGTQYGNVIVAGEGTGRNRRYRVYRASDRTPIGKEFQKKNDAKKLAYLLRDADVGEAGAELPQSAQDAVGWFYEEDKPTPEPVQKPRGEMTSEQQQERDRLWTMAYEPIVKTIEKSPEFRADPDSAVDAAVTRIGELAEQVARGDREHPGDKQWVKTAVRAGVNAARDARNRIAKEGQLGEEQDLVEGRSPEQQAAEAYGVSSDSLGKAMESLTPAQREVIERFYGMGGKQQQTKQEIANELGKSRQAVSSLIAKAEEKLHDALAPDAARELGIDPDDIVGAISHTNLGLGTGAAVKRLWKQILGWFRARRELPLSAFDIEVESAHRLRRRMEEVREIGLQFRRALKRHLGKRLLTDDERLRINRALRSDKDALRSLPAELRPHINKMRVAIDLLSAEMIERGIVQGKMVPIFLGNSGVYLHRSYKAFTEPKKWRRNVPQHVINRAMVELRNQYPEKSQSELEGILQELLHVGDNAKSPMDFLTGGMEGSKDLGILKHRKNVPEWLRALWGENQDPLLNYSVTTSRMLKLIEAHRFQQEIREVGLAEGWLSEHPTRENYEQIAPKDSRVMSELAGLYTTPEIAKEFQRQINPARVWKPIRYYLKAVGFTQAAKTVFSLMTHVRNTMTIVPKTVLLGAYDPTKLSKAAGVFISGLARRDSSIGTLAAAWESKNMRDRYFRYVELGLIGESTHGGDLEHFARNIDPMMFSEYIREPSEFNARKILQAAREPARAAMQLYQLEDAFIKVYLAENFLQDYEKAYPEKSRDELERMAARKVIDCYATYYMVPKAVKALRDLPMIGQVGISWAAETIRNQYHAIRYMTHHLRTPRERMMGIKMLAGHLLWYGALDAAIKMLMYALGFNDDDVEAMRQHVPYWETNATLVPLKRSGDKIHYLNLSYQDSQAYFKDSIRAAIRGESWEDKFFGTASELAEPFFGEKILWKNMTEWWRNSTEYGTQVYNPQDTWWQKAKDIGWHIEKAFEPGTITSARRIKAGAEGRVRPSGRGYNFWVELIAATMGMRLETLDIKQETVGAGRRFRSDLRNVEDILSSESNSRGTVTESELKKSYDRMEQRRKAIFEEAQKQMEASVTLGVEWDEAAQLMRDAGVNESLVEDLVSGSYTPYRLSRQRIAAIVRSNPEEAPQRVELLLKQERKHWKEYGIEAELDKTRRKEIAAASYSIAREVRLDKEEQESVDRAKQFLDLVGATRSDAVNALAVRLVKEGVQPDTAMEWIQRLISRLSSRSRPNTVQSNK